MKPCLPKIPKTRLALAIATTALLVTTPALADKPSWAGNDKGGKNDRGDQRDERKAERRDDGDRHGKQKNPNSDGDRRHFQPQQNVLVHDYYAKHYKGSRCPPGLAKKNNGCMPPGQAKKWRLGYQLPRDVVYYSVPAPLVIQLGTPPAGHRYVRVAGDILLLAIGTGMVVDAIQDLGGM